MVFSYACAMLTTTSNSLLKINCINGYTGQLFLIWQTTTYNFTGAAYLQNNIKHLEQPKCLENLATKRANLRMWDTQTLWGFFYSHVFRDGHGQPSHHAPPPTRATSPCSSTSCFPDRHHEGNAMLCWDDSLPLAWAFLESVRGSTEGTIQPEEFQSLMVHDGQTFKYWTILNKL